MTKLKINLIILSFLLINVFFSNCSIAQKKISNHEINKIENITSAHSQLFNQIQQQITDNQKDIGILYNSIQEIQHNVSKIIQEQEKYLCELIKNNKYLLSSKSHTQEIQKIIDVINENINNNSDKYKKERNDYNKVLTLILEKKQHDQAINMLQNFIKKYPDSVYQDQTYYWLGELNYIKNKKDDAIYYFSLVVKYYPKSIKIPDSLFRMGNIMQENKQIKKAKIIYQQLIKLYPNTNIAKKAQKYLVNI